MICGHSFFKPSQTQNNQEIIAQTQRYHFRWPSHHGEHHYYSFNLNYPLLTQQQPDNEIRPSHNKMHFPHDATHTEWSPPLAVSLSGLTGWWDSHEKMWNSPMDTNLSEGIILGTPRCYNTNLDLKDQENFPWIIKHSWK